jgi:hypothetical protein
MDLLSISRTVWRHKVATIPVILIMLVGAAYVVAVKKPEYTTASSFVLLPAPQFTQQQLASDPALKGANPNNPFVSYGDLSVVVDLLSEVMNSAAEGQALAQQGVTGTYTVAPLSTAYGNAPIIQISSTAYSAAAATRSATLIGMAFQTQLNTLQAAQGTSQQFRISTLELSHPNQPQEQLSSKLRDLVAVIALGVILLFVSVSTMNAREEAKRERLLTKSRTADPTGWQSVLADPSPEEHASEPDRSASKRTRKARFVRPSRKRDGRAAFEAERKHSIAPPRLQLQPEGQNAQDA